MKFVKWLIIFVAVLFGLFLLITFFLPREYSVARSIEIEAPAEVVYSQVVDLEAWQEWNPWYEIDPEMAISYGEKKVGTGASYSWESDVAGNGQMTIIATEPNAYVEYELVFEGYEELPSTSGVHITPGEEEEPTAVRWTFEGSVGKNFFARWMSVMADKFIGSSYEKGLQSLKERCEALAADPEAVMKKIPIP